MNPFENLDPASKWNIMIGTERDRIQIAKETRRKKPSLRWPHGNARRNAPKPLEGPGRGLPPQPSRFAKPVREKYPGQSKRYLVGAWRGS